MVNAGCAVTEKKQKARERNRKKEREETDRGRKIVHTQMNKSEEGDWCTRRGGGESGRGKSRGVAPPRMALRSYAAWLVEKARDKAVVVAAEWVDL